jgi:CheY-like chemotaxis protein
MTVATTSCRPSGRRVVLIDDDPAMRMLVARLLDRRPDIELVDAATGAAGIAAITETPPTLVLLDIQLPDISGLDILRRLRSDPTTAYLPVVVVTAMAVREHIDAMLTHGATGYLTKPLDLSHLLDLIDRLA